MPIPNIFWIWKLKIVASWFVDSLKAIKMKMDEFITMHNKGWNIYP
jgi:hypothetical protein